MSNLDPIVFQTGDYVAMTLIDAVNTPPDEVTDSFERLGSIGFMNKFWESWAILARVEDVGGETISGVRLAETNSPESALVELRALLDIAPGGRLNDGECPLRDVPARS